MCTAGAEPNNGACFATFFSNRKSPGNIRKQFFSFTIRSSLELFQEQNAQLT